MLEHKLDLVFWPKKNKVQDKPNKEAQIEDIIGEV
jgi:hypothetical protein